MDTSLAVSSFQIAALFGEADKPCIFQTEHGEAAPNRREFLRRFPTRLPIYA
jgi:hypothetical protein